MLKLKQHERHSLVGSLRYWKLKRNFQYSFIKDRVHRTNSFLDYGCGTLRGGIPIIRMLDQGNYTGVDVRPEAIAEARKECNDYGLSSMQPSLLHIEKASDTPMGPYDVIFIFDTIIHLSDEIVEDVFAMCNSRISDNSVIYFNANAGVTHEDAEWREFPVVFRQKEFYQDLADKYGMAIRAIGTLQQLGHNNGDVLQNAQIMFEMRPYETV